MSVLTVLVRGWRRFLAAFDVNDHQTLLEGVCDAYRAEVNAVTQCTQHAHRMYYPQFRAELLRIAAEEQAQIPWLREQILALGGNLPLLSCTPTMGSNSWECLRFDVDEAQRGCVNLLEWIHLAEQTEPELALGLGRIRKEKLKHREEFRDMLMKSDPYTTPNTAPLQEPEEHHRQAWLEQRKGEWLEQERAEWEAGGKQTSWAEWSGERECRWATELPHRDLEWVRYQAEQRTA
jgi:hypothetical protein